MTQPDSQDTHKIHSDSYVTFWESPSGANNKMWSGELTITVALPSEVVTVLERHLSSLALYFGGSMPYKDLSSQLRLLGNTLRAYCGERFMSDENAP